MVRAQAKAAAPVLASSSKGIPTSTIATIESFILQLRGLQQGADGPPDKVAAATALGCLPSFLPARLRPDALLVAVELGAWQALVAVLENGFDTSEVEDAAAVSMAHLLALPPSSAGDGAGGARSSPAKPAAPASPAFSAAVRRLAEQLCEDEYLLAQLAAVLTSTSNSSQVLLAVARIVTIAATRHAVHPANDHLMAASPLPRALMDVVALPAKDHHLRDGVACALACLALASATPDLFHNALRDGLFDALAALYKRSIDPGTHSSLVNPADAAALLLRATSLEPWVRFEAMPRSKTMKQLLGAVLEGGVVECLVSYAAVEAGNTRAKAAQAAAATVQVLEAILPHVRSRLLALATPSPDLGVLLSAVNDRLQDQQIKLQELLDPYDAEGRGWLTRSEALSLLYDLLPAASSSEVRALALMLDSEGSGRMTPDSLLQARKQREAALAVLRQLPPDLAAAVQRTGQRILTAPAAASEAFYDADAKGSETLDPPGCTQFLQQLVPELSKEHVDGCVTRLLLVLNPPSKAQPVPRFPLNQLLIALHGASSAQQLGSDEDVPLGSETDVVEERLSDLRAELGALKRAAQGAEARLRAQEDSGSVSGSSRQRRYRGKACREQHSDLGDDSYSNEIKEEGAEGEDLQGQVQELWERRARVKREYGELRGSCRMLGRLLRQLRGSQGRLQGLADRYQPSVSAPRKVKRCAPNLPLLREVLALMAGLATPPDTANKDADPEQQELTAQVHRRLFSGGLLPACLRLVDTMHSTSTLAREAAVLLLGSLRLPAQLVELLRSCRLELVEMVQALHSVSSRVAAKLRAVQDEARRVSKALSLGIPRATHGRYIPLNDVNCLSPGVDPAEVESRANDLALQERALALMLEDVTAERLRVQGLGAQLDERLATLEAAASKCSHAYPEVQEAVQLEDDRAAEAARAAGPAGTYEAQAAFGLLEVTGT